MVAGLSCEVRMFTLDKPVSITTQRWDLITLAGPRLVPLRRAVSHPTSPPLASSRLPCATHHTRPREELCVNTYTY